MQKNINNKNSTNNNKHKIRIILVITILIISSIGILFTNKNKDEYNTEIAYEILDTSVVEDKEVLQSWIDENSENKGAYYTTTDDYIYILITNGKTTQSGVGICLEDFKIDSKINVKYSIVSNNSDEIVEEYTPQMLIKLPLSNKKIVFEEVDYE